MDGVPTNRENNNEIVNANEFCRRLPITPAEAGVLEAMMNGELLTRIAALRGLTLETVHTYVKAMLRKTEQHSQAQLESRNEANAAWP